MRYLCRRVLNCLERNTKTTLCEYDIQLAYTFYTRTMKKNLRLNSKLKNKQKNNVSSASVKHVQILT